MSVLVYAISRDARPRRQTADAGGLNLGRHLRQITYAGLTADVESIDRQVAADWAALARYEQVVEEIAERAAMLPMRFGSVLDDDDAVRSLLGGRAAELGTALDRVEGATEFGLRVLWQDGSGNPAGAGVGAGGAGTGTAYMQQRLQARMRALELQCRLEETLGPCARDAVYRLAPDDRTAIAAAYLVERDVVDTFRERVAELEASADGAVRCSGPWPPYSFVGDLNR